MTPKRLRLGDMSEEDSVSSSGLSSGRDLTTLKYALALVKGELGSKDKDPPYNTVHGGIQAIHETLSHVNQEHLKVKAGIKG